MPQASRPPVIGTAATQGKAWADDLVKHLASLLLEGDDDEREQLLMRAASARFLQLHLRELEKRYVVAGQQAGASNERVAFALGVRPSTVSTQYPSPHRPRRPGEGGWRTT